MVYIIAEIGINHNGDMDICHQLIEEAAKAGCDAVKFQKRTVEDVYTAEELDKPREHPWGDTNRALKERLELDHWDYEYIDDVCRERRIDWFASCWDKKSVDFIAEFSPPAYKVPSALLTDHELLEYTCRVAHRDRIGAPAQMIMSTGMSTLEQIDQATDLCFRERAHLTLMHCTAVYPCPSRLLNLRCIPALRDRYAHLGVQVGYSGHEVGLTATYAAVALGAQVIERHITLDRSMFGSDQSASIEPQGLQQLVKGIRSLEVALGDGHKVVYDEEMPALQKLRKVTS